ncbi:hypothetical protein [Vibrio sagamiensis]|uniref:hypothetical protein n=1 Tax=Vibrio sagamiensis TaxID=512650 RepID=UPI0003A00F69|nr:hypothetical protein [Vibrio sagamiensis]PNQ67398.1 hypothetical protein C1141_08125 [Vibrio agarivorans]
MLFILLAFLVFGIFWLLFHNRPGKLVCRTKPIDHMKPDHHAKLTYHTQSSHHMTSRDTVTNSSTNKVTQTRAINHKGIKKVDARYWLRTCSQIYQPYCLRTTFFAIAYFSNFIASANALYLASYSEQKMYLLLSRTGQSFVIDRYTLGLWSGFIALVSFVITWHFSVYCAGKLGKYLHRIISINYQRFSALCLGFCCSFSYLLLISIFWLFRDDYSIWHGLSLTPFFFILTIPMLWAIPLPRTSISKHE